MKKVLQFSGLISLGLALVAFIIMMAGHSVVYTSDAANNWYSGISAIFGGGTAKITISGFGLSLSSGVTEVDAKLAWCSLLSWIFVLIGMLIIVIGIVFPLLKINALEKFAGILNLVSVALLVVGGIFLFFTVPAFAAANEWNNSDGWGLSAGWVISAIMLIIAGVFAILPAAAAFIGSKKK